MMSSSLSGKHDTLEPASAIFLSRKSHYFLSSPKSTLGHPALNMNAQDTPLVEISWRLDGNIYIDDR